MKRKQAAILTAEESRAIFDAEAQRSMGMSGDDFLARLDAGELADKIDDPAWHSKIMRVYILLPLVRKVPVQRTGK